MLGITRYSSGFGRLDKGFSHPPTKTAQDRPNRGFTRVQLAHTGESSTRSASPGARPAGLDADLLPGFADARRRLPITPWVARSPAPTAVLLEHPRDLSPRVTVEAPIGSVGDSSARRGPPSPLPHRRPATGARRARPALMECEERHPGDASQRTRIQKPLWEKGSRDRGG